MRTFGKCLLIILCLCNLFYAELIPKRALLVIQPGFEEIQLTTILEQLRSAGVSVTLARLPETNRMVIGAHGLSVDAPHTLPTSNDTLDDVIILTANLHSYGALLSAPALGKLLHRYEETNGTVAALDCAQAVLAYRSIYVGKNLTVNPALQATVEKDYVLLPDEPLVVDIPLITAHGALTTLNFSKAILTALMSKELPSRTLNEPISTSSSSKPGAISWLNFIILILFVCNIVLRK